MEQNTNQQQDFKTIPLFNRKEFKTQAKQTLAGRRIVPLLATLVASAIGLIIFLCLYPWELVSDPNSLLYADTTEVLLSMFLTMIKLFIFEAFILLAFPIIMFAGYWMYQQLYKNPDSVTFGTFINGFTFWKKAIPGFLWQTLWLYLWTMAGYAIFFIAAIIIAIVCSLVLPNVGSVGTVITIILSIIIGLGAIAVFMGIVLNRTYAYSMTLYILSDNPKIGAMKALDLSKKMTNGYKRKLFILDLSFIGWELLGILSLGIGYLWILPYITLVIINAYHRLKAIAISSGTLSEEDFAAPLSIEATTAENKLTEVSEPKAIESTAPVVSEAKTVESTVTETTSVTDNSVEEETALPNSATEQKEE